MFLGRFTKFGRAVQHVQRFRAIIGVFLKYGYEDLAGRLPLPSPLRLPFRKMRQKQEEISLLSQPERLRRAFEELGPTFVKFGQLLSTRTLLLPRRLHRWNWPNCMMRCRPFRFTRSQAFLKSELKPSALRFFPVHRRDAHRLGVHCPGPSGHPRQRREDASSKSSARALRRSSGWTWRSWPNLAALLENHVEGWRVHQPTAMVAEFARQMEQELDFTAPRPRTSNGSPINSPRNPPFMFPRFFPTPCTRRVLTMEYIDAIKASQLDVLDAAGAGPPEIATRITDLVMKQIFVHGFFHADPHPGNIHILPGNVICFLDFGMMGFLDLQTREVFSRFVISIAQRNEAAHGIGLLKLAHAELDPSAPGFEADVAEFMHQHFYRPVGEMVFGNLSSICSQLTRQASADPAGGLIHRAQGAEPDGEPGLPARPRATTLSGRRARS